MMSQTVHGVQNVNFLPLLRGRYIYGGKPEKHQKSGGKPVKGNKSCGKPEKEVCRKPENDIFESRKPE